ncbi:MAG: hypothetical protein JO297_14275 [Nitrososphaeraceae archaeon]|nr:hypothetical protein [Nitrososphaeraceae archaeon]
MKEQARGISSNELFAWHIREGVFERLNPHWHQFKVIERKGSIQNSGTVKIKMKIAGPIHTIWLVVDRAIIDTQTSLSFSRDMWL